MIAPLGKLGSPKRKRIDQICNKVIIPALKERGYEFHRSDMIKATGVIYQQIVNHLRYDDLVIADLTKLNANVIFELGIRHAINKPVIHIKETNQRLPFDVSAIRCIDFDFGIDDSMIACKDEIIAYIKNMDEHPEEVQLPFDAVLAMGAIDKNEAQKKVNLEILTELQNIRIEIKALKPSSKESETHYQEPPEEEVEGEEVEEEPPEVEEADVDVQEAEALAEREYAEYFEEHGHYPDDPPPDVDLNDLEGSQDENPDEEETPPYDPRDER